jgi:cytochrome c5
MKSGEKLVLRVVLASVVAIVGLTIFLESDYQKSSPEDEINTPKKVQQTASNIQQNRQNILLIPKGMNPDDLPSPDSHGATVLSLYCTQCHDLPTPAMHTANEWPDVVARMENYLRGKQGGMLSRTMMPSKQDWTDLGTYLRENAQIPLQQGRYSDLDSPEGLAYSNVCSQCHALPSPQSHTKREWPRVVLRMESNMLSANRRVPNTETRLLIIDFLQRHSKASQPS